MFPKLIGRRLFLVGLAATFGVILMAGFVFHIEISSKTISSTGSFDCNTVMEIPLAECEALVALYNNTDGPNWTYNAGWLVTNTPCSWNGISCDSTPQVIEIRLIGNNLNGFIPLELGDLTNLQVLLLGPNQLTGPIPAELGNLTNLRELALFENYLSGEIPPALGGLINLERLHLGSNLLTGTIPADLGNLINLKTLYLDGNALSGEIPSNITNLVNLVDDQTWLWDFRFVGAANLSYNMLTASDPAVLAFLSDKDPDWADTQTVLPTNFQVENVIGNRIELSWTPILYTGDGGYYEVSHATTDTGPYTVHGTTEDKTASGYTANSLMPDTTYYFRVRTHTPAHNYYYNYDYGAIAFQHNDLWSNYTEVISATTGVLVITKTTPLTSTTNSLITYTITVTNYGQTAVTDLTITDTLPTGANYISGGALSGDEVQWTFPTLGSNSGVSVQYWVTATHTVANLDYWATTQEGEKAKGNPVVTTITDDPKTLNFCLEDEPETLYLYDGDVFSIGWSILQAVYDGPIDKRDYSYQPIILQSIPTLDNGGAVFESVAVSEGSMVVNADGFVVELAVGETIRPSGCFRSECAIVYGGGSVNMDQLRVTFELLPGLAWSDGVPLTANDSEYSFSLNADPDTPSPNSFIRSVIDRTTSYTAINTTQTVWLGLPGYFDAAYPSFFWKPLPEHLWGNMSALNLLFAKLSTETPLGWGPYIIDEWVKGSHILLHRNPNYFRAGEGLPAFDALVFHFVSDLETALRAGKCDVLPFTNTDLNTLGAYESQGLLDLVITDGLAWDHLDFDLLPVGTYTGFAGQTLAFQDVNIRQAFAYCIDRQAIADEIYNYLGVVPNSYVPNSHPYYPAGAVSYPYNPTQGNALLDAAGWVDSNGNGIRDKDGVEFSLSLITVSIEQRITSASMIASQMLACGVEVIPDYRPAGEVYQDGPDGPIFGRQFDLAEIGRSIGMEPPCDLYLSEAIPGEEYLYGWGGWNDAGYSNPQYDQTCKDALAAPNIADQQALHGLAILTFTQELPVLPLYQWLAWGGQAPDIYGYVINAASVDFRAIIDFWSIEEIHRAETVNVDPLTSTTLVFTDTEGYATTIEIPAGAVTDSASMIFKPAEDNGFTPPDFLFANHAFEINAFRDGLPIEGLTFEKPVTITIHYGDEDVAGLDENSLLLETWDEITNTWTDAACGPYNRHPKENWLAIPICHLSQFGLFGKLAPEGTQIYLPTVVR